MTVTVTDGESPAQTNCGTTDNDNTLKGKYTRTAPPFVINMRSYGYKSAAFGNRAEQP